MSRELWTLCGLTDGADERIRDVDDRISIPAHPGLVDLRPDSQDELDVVLLCLGDQVLDLFGTSLVKERLADLDAIDNLLEGECHASADDERVDLRVNRGKTMVSPGALDGNGVTALPSVNEPGPTCGR